MIANEPDRDDVKPLLASRTFWMQVVGVASSMAAIWGIDVPPEQQALIVTGIVSAWGAVNVVIRIVTKARIGRRE